MRCVLANRSMPRDGPTAPLATRYACGSSAEDQQQSSVTLNCCAPRSPAARLRDFRPAAARGGELADTHGRTRAVAVVPRGVPMGRHGPDLWAPIVEGG